jgi:hypothetical protein
MMPCGLVHRFECFRPTTLQVDGTCSSETLVPIINPHGTIYQTGKMFHCTTYCENKVQPVLETSHWIHPTLIKLAHAKAKTF